MESTEMKMASQTSSRTPEVMYFKLSGVGGEDYYINFIELPPGIIITGMEFGFQNKGEEKRPIVRLPFTMHGDIKTLHTICGRYDDDEIWEYER